MFNFQLVRKVVKAFSVLWPWPSTFSFSIEIDPVQRCPCTKFIDPRLSRFIARQYDRVIVFSHFCRFYRRCKIPKGTPLADAINSRRGEKFGIFDRNCRLSRKRFEIGPRLPWITNRCPSIRVSFDDLEWRWKAGLMLSVALGFVSHLT